MQDVYANVTKVMVDTHGGTNLIQVPLDKLTQAAAAATAPAAAAQPDAGAAATAPAAPTDPAADARSRDNSRTRDRDTR
jgi:modulator of FtsH protease HflK